MMIRFERRTNDLGQFLAIPLLVGFLYGVYWLWSRSNLEGVFPFGLYLVISFAGAYGIFNCARKIVFPYTEFVELNEDAIIYGRVEYESNAVTVAYSEIESLFLNGDDGYVTLVDIMKKTHVFGTDLGLRNVEFEKMFNHLKNHLSTQQINFLPYDGTHLGAGPKMTTEQTHAPESRSGRF
jgi:hypothetical protein